MMDIREFEIRDQPAVIELWNECQLVVPWNDPAKDIERKIKVDPDLFLVGELSGLIVATVMGGYEGHRGWINYLAVSPAHQRKGLGRAIMEQVEQRIRARGCPKINLQVRETNQAVIAFYESLGYNVDPVVGLGKRLESDL
ncbi:Acetyltransferase YpeA [Gimesia panareensis]|uniref:Acetyltransferase YpeA n=2 Tax=Gimesia panareensis TaxID=2527978 RepID=A0A518FHS9_9PLAN|nr:GNAT family acetyltransferase [Gimesia panareensis]QDV15907.1 Acetyltransferase YpeA [Gimesia panareensis]